MAKLKKLLEDVFSETEQINKHEVIEGVRNFSIIGKHLYNSNIVEVAKQLSKIAENAHSHVLSETDDWFDKVSVNKNMKTLKTNVAEFKKAAMEAHQLNQRLTGLYEDIGHVLNRYYDISEDLDEDIEESLDHNETLADKPEKEGNGRVNNLDTTKESLDPDNRDQVDQPSDPSKDGYEMKEDKGDMDNDGKDEPDDEEYLDNKDKAIKKAMKKESRNLRDVGGVVGIPALGQIARKLAGK
tara:strand:- start:51 stop:773 length:723 start_codon:yes stop_codon:yes gene_type:complete